MPRRDYRRLLLPLVVAAVCAVSLCGTIAVPHTSNRYLEIGMVLGTLLSHSLLATAWATLGPGGWWRLPLATVWMLLVPFAFVVKHGFDNVSALLFTQWATLALSCFLAISSRLLFNVQIIRSSPQTPESRAVKGDDLQRRTVQFGILHLVTVTTAVAILLGVARLLLVSFRQSLGGLAELSTFAFLVVAALVMSIPLLLAILSMKRPIISTAVVLVFIGVGTAYEVSLLQAIGLSGPDWLHILLINLFCLGQVLVVSIAARASGYRLAGLRREPLQSTAGPGPEQAVDVFAD
jgi:hypothetical protein